MPPHVSSGLRTTYAPCNLRSMTLKEYLRDTEDTVEKLASRTGLSTATISRISNNLQNASRDTIEKIVNGTGGRVPPNSFFGIAA